MIKSADIQQLGVGLGLLSNIVCTYFFRSSSTGILVSFADTCSLIFSGSKVQRTCDLRYKRTKRENMLFSSANARSYPCSFN